MPFKKNNRYGKRFSQQNQPHIQGRKPSIYKLVAKQISAEMNLQLSREDYTKIQQWVIERKISELIEILDEPRIPAFLSIMIKSILSDIKHGKTENLDRIYDRIFGRSTINYNALISNRDTYNLQSLNDSEFETLVKLIQKIS